MKPIRVRTLFLLVAAGSALATGFLVYLAVAQSVRAELVSILDPDWTDGMVRRLAITIAAGTLLALALALYLAGTAANRLRRSLEALGRRIEGVADAPAPFVDPGAGELAELERAVRTALIRERRTTARHAAAHADLGELLDTVGEGILQVGADGRIVRYNRAAQRILRLARGSVGELVSLVVRKRALRRRLLEIFAGEENAPFEITIDNRRLLVSCTAVQRTENAVESIVAWVVVFVDLTDLRRLEDVRRDFVANASHELKTPLTSIRGYSETLLNDTLPPETQRQFLETIHANAARLQRIVDDLLDLSRIESGRWQPNSESLDVEQVAEDAWATCAGEAARKDIRFEVQGSGAVVADRVALAQVLSNLFENAIRHTPPGGEVTVRIEAAHDAPEAVAVSVVDTGAGIPRDALPRVFERFYRVDPARARDGGGTGLGLAIVKHLVEAMGGAVRAESELGRGTVVTFELPPGERP